MNNIIKVIKRIRNEDILNKYIEYRINKLSKESIEYNIKNDTIGSIIGINSYENKVEDKFLTIDTYIDYIPKGKRIVYGAFTDSICRLYNKGYYYYLDDDQYIYDFVKYIKNIDINIDTINDLVIIIYDFLTSYLYKSIDPIDREVLHQLILENSTSYFKPIKEHSIRDFYGNGSAKCTEYSIMGQNILSFMNIESYLMFDTEHAYNIIYYNNMYYLIDFSNTIGLFDFDFKFIREFPFFVDLYGFDDSKFQELVDRKSTLILDNFNYIYIGSKLFEVYDNKKRNYSCGGKLIEEEKISLLGDEIIEPNEILLPGNEEEKGNSMVLKLEK